MASIMNDPIYIIKTTKAHEKEDVRRILYEVLGTDSIDRLLSIDGVDCDKRVFVVSFWRIPSVNLFHDDFTESTNYLLGKEIPWPIEQMDKYRIFTDGHYPAPHFLRNSTNLSDEELDELGIGGLGEFIYTNLPRDEGCETHWEMYRCGVYYMPDMTYYNRPRLEPLAAIDRPPAIRHGPPTLYKSFADVNPKMEEYDRWDGFMIDKPDTWPKDLTEEEMASLEVQCKPLEVNTSGLKRWRDFYIEHPKTWPTDLTEEERARLQERYDEEYIYKSPWTPECGRDPTNMAEQQENLEKLEKLKLTLPQRCITESWPDISRQETDQPGFERWMASQDGTGPLTINCVPEQPVTRQQTAKSLDLIRQCGLERQVTGGLPVRELNKSLLTPYPAHCRTFLVDYKFVSIKDKKVYRSFDS